jgi:acetyl-CoA acetyltransferase
MSDAVIVAAIRTPIGRAGRGLAGLSLQGIGSQTVAAAIATAGLDANDIAIRAFAPAHLCVARRKPQ